MKKERILTKAWVVAIGAIISCALWGSAFPCIKIGYRLLNIASDDVSTQILFAGVRFTLAGVLSIVFESIIERRDPASKKKFHGKYSEILSDADGHPVSLLLYWTGTRKRSNRIDHHGNEQSSGDSDCLLHLPPGKMTLPTLVGCVIGLAGVVVANLAEAGIGTQMHLNGEGFVFIAALFYAHLIDLSEEIFSEG